MIWLNDMPHTAAQRLAFERYMGGGGGWLGFHVSGFGTNAWPWFTEFMGGGRFSASNWPSMPARVNADDPAHPILKGVPATFVAPINEWYSWTPSPRANPDVKVLLTLDGSNFPLGVKNTLNGGDIPVAWINTKYRMVYVNYGHGDQNLLGAASADDDRQHPAVAVVAVDRSIDGRTTQMTSSYLIKCPEHDPGTGELHHAQVVPDVSLPTGDHAPAVVEPRRTDFRAPFFADAKVASTKASLRSICRGPGGPRRQALQQPIEAGPSAARVEATMASLVRRIARWQVVPRRARAQDPQDAVHDDPRIGPRPAAPIRATARAEGRFEHGPLDVGEVDAVECHDGDPTDVSVEAARLSGQPFSEVRRAAERPCAKHQQ